MAISLWHQWDNILATFLGLLLIFPTIRGQDTQRAEGCTFYDETNIYRITLTRGPDVACPTITTLNDKFKQSSDRLLETSYEVMQLQGTVIRLQQQNAELSNLIKALQQKIDIRPDTGTGSTCPLSYERISDDQNSCYMFVNRSKTWYEAETFCMSTGGHLVAIETREEQEMIRTALKNKAEFTGKHVWTGANDIAKEGQWVWTGWNIPVNYTEWMTLTNHPSGSDVNMPDNHENSEHCMQLFAADDFAWNDMVCWKVFYFMCEYRLQ